ncbi:uncharacterized protein K441DRAFT_674283 [Cenococcum geophilum 1.58]|uniref:uncharacterized protein n=1 Tax=Cenococcum geophilum 1.58 TaxID=794803 RepID=UPI00358E848E|nr:hypothetical protein K441DRAFT_674283 [Cenococcum geophilum 1.58]
MNLPTNEFARVMSDVLLTEKDANLVVACGDIIWKVHNKVLEGRLRYCQALLKTDAVTYDLPYVDFSEYHPIVVDGLLEWIYTNGYITDRPGQLRFSTLHSTEYQIDPPKIPVIHMKLVLAGEGFMLVGLGRVALTQLGDSLEKEWDAE